VRETTQLYTVLINSFGTRQLVVPGRKCCCIEMIALSGNPQSETVDSHKMLVLLVKLKVKVKFTLEQATKAQRGSRGIALLFP